MRTCVLTVFSLFALFFSSVALILFFSICLAVLCSDRPSRSHPVVPNKVAEVGQEAGRQLGGA